MTGTQGSILPESGLHTGVVSGIRLLARLARVAEQTCQAEGVSLPQYRLLVAASGAPERASSLATAVGVTRPTLSSLVNGLEEAGLLVFRNRAELWKPTQLLRDWPTSS